MPRQKHQRGASTEPDKSVNRIPTMYNWGGSRQGAGRPPINFKIPDLDAVIARWFNDLSDEAKADIVTKAYQEND